MNARNIKRILIAVALAAVGLAGYAGFGTHGCYSILSRAQAASTAAPVATAAARAARMVDFSTIVADKDRGRLGLALRALTPEESRQAGVAAGLIVEDSAGPPPRPASSRAMSSLHWTADR